MTALRPIFVVGLQGSGTTLLARLLQDTGLAENPFRGEGKKFWGNYPPSAPEGHPAGTLYWRHGGEAGHELEEEDALDDVVEVLRDRLARLESDRCLVVNHNPYNMVRLPWLRTVFPEAVILAVARKPVPNVYSIAKRFVPHPGRGRGPDEDGWWGVKPRGWRVLIDEDKVIQIARQWAATNQRMIETSEFVDAVFRYDRVCSDPAGVLREVADHATGNPPDGELPIPELRCYDDEYRTGSRLRSKNWPTRRRLRERQRAGGSLETPENEEVEFPPFTSGQIEAVEFITAEVDTRLLALFQDRASPRGRLAAAPKGRPA
jgi:hypothetical protein